MSRWDRFWAWTRRTLDMLCDRPEHLQRLSIIGAGMKSGLLVVGVIAILTWFGKSAPALALLVVPILGTALYMLIAAFIICIVVLLGLVKGLDTLKGMLPGGASFELTATPAAQGKTELLEIVTSPSGDTVETATTTTVTATPAPPEGNTP